MMAARPGNQTGSQNFQELKNSQLVSSFKSQISNLRVGVSAPLGRHIVLSGLTLDRILIGFVVIQSQGGNRYRFARNRRGLISGFQHRLF